MNEIILAVQDAPTIEFEYTACKYTVNVDDEDATLNIELTANVVSE